MLEHHHNRSATLQRRENRRVGRVVVADTIHRAVRDNSAPRVRSWHRRRDVASCSRETRHACPCRVLQQLSTVTWQLERTRLRPHLHHFNRQLRAAHLRHASVKVIEAQICAPNDEWRATRVQELVPQLHVREEAVPVLVERPLRRETRTEQVDCAKVSHAIALKLALDAIMIRVPRAILGLVGDAQVDLRVEWRAADIADVDLGRRRRHTRAIDALVRRCELAFVNWRVGVASPALAAEV